MAKDKKQISKKCVICGKEFKTDKPRVSTDEPFCKDGLFRQIYLRAMFRRYNRWVKDAKASDIKVQYAKLTIDGEDISNEAEKPEPKKNGKPDMKKLQAEVDKARVVLK